ncbi:hypothetical protein TNIN_20651 [Trichonephila inaurata madagascariensis]|uniref:Uncharacterized protein n=1 Tax=Trichonephila inaurata madagascariensis TaxID=2747483 RepID=A0A8X6MJG0_9ARAC|nr:hypothetical protein TNIN_20651 [Trichonephila inaurata madagascariensis]
MATDGDSPLPLALLGKATAGVSMSHDPLAETTAVSLLEPSEIENACLLAIGLLGPSNFGLSMGDDDEFFAAWTLGPKVPLVQDFFNTQ